MADTVAELGDEYEKLNNEPESEAGEDFAKHHAGSLGAGDMGHLAAPDTYDWDDKEKGKEGEEGGHQFDKDQDDRGYEPVKEAKKRDYKAEYKKYGSSKKSKKYRAELNKYNRQKGTYGNGDKKDASHKGGKIVGFEEQSKNRGRREKSRLKKEQKLREVIRKMIREDFAGAYPAHKREKFDNKRRKQSEVLGY